MSNTAKWGSLVALLLIISGWLWYQRVCLKPQNVFWGMVQNNLASNGAVRQTNQAQGAQSLDQYTHLQVGAQNAVHTVVVARQGQGANAESFTKESIATPSAEYARYTKIETSKKDAQGKPQSYAGIKGVWGKNDQPDVAGSSFTQAMLTTFPMAQLNPRQRAKLIKTMRDSKVYSVDYGKVNKHRENGQNLYTYNVLIYPEAYFKMLKDFAKMAGLNAGLVPNPDQYKKLQPVAFEISVKPTARQLAKVRYPNAQQDELYGGYGLSQLIEIPKTSIPLSELQKRVEAVQ